ncbi:MAG: WbqC family protein [Candidatus Staskawiczbacteria bacterium]|jgi:hypothetical protein
MTTITIHQPEYLPYLGFFDRIINADAFVILDDVNYQKNGFINRNKIKTADSWQWLTVPISNRSPNQKICEVFIDNQKDWKNDHWKALCYNYSKAPFFKNYADFFEDVFKREWTLISDLDVYLIENIIRMLGLNKRIGKSSTYNINETATSRLVNICKKFDADTYLSGIGGGKYMELEKFQKENINLVFQDFKHPEYSQGFMRNGFLANLSIIDLLFNCGPKSIDIILSGSK